MRALAPAAEREAAVETGGYQVVFRIPGPQFGFHQRRREGVSPRPRRRSRPTSCRARRPRSTRPRSSKPRSGRPTRRRCCPAVSRSTATASMWDAARSRSRRRTRPCGSASAPTTRSRSRARRCARSKARPASSRRPRPTSANTRSPCAAATSAPIRMIVEDQIPTSENRGHQGRTAAGHHAADRARRARPARRARLELRRRAGRDAGDQARLAAALARGQDGRLRAAPALIPPRGFVSAQPLGR